MEDDLESCTRSFETMWLNLHSVEEDGEEEEEGGQAHQIGKKDDLFPHLVQALILTLIKGFSQRKFKSFEKSEIFREFVQWKTDLWEPN